MTTAKAQKLSRTNNMYFNDGMAAMLILQKFLSVL
jgi:RNase H-fold protein (predicted Holliday junction resolvase)